MTDTSGLSPATQTALTLAQAALNDAKQASLHAQSVLTELEQELKDTDVKSLAIEKTLQEEVNAIVQSMDENVLKLLEEI